MPGGCDAAGENWFDITLNNGATPNYNGGTLPHGTYKATLAAGNVKDAAGNTMASDWSTTFTV